MKVLVTGYAGFIGSNLCRFLLDKPEIETVYGLDVFTYAASPKWIHDYVTENALDGRFRRIYLDLVNEKSVREMMDFVRPDHVFHLAAETHVCNSIRGPRDFLNSNVIGTFNLIEAFRKLDGRSGASVFHHVSTDEVFGELSLGDPAFTEMTAYDPRSPYAATKAASDFLIKSYFETYGVNTRITNCTNNFGPNQHREKLIPRTIDHFMNSKPIVIHGNGDHVRDWIHVDDHCAAIWQAFKWGRPGEQYCVGGNMELTNLEVVSRIIAELKCLGLKHDYEVLHTNDRPTDDFRYAVDTRKIEGLGWKPDKDSFNRRLKETCEWYIKIK